MQILLSWSPGPSRARQNKQARAGTNFTKPRTSLFSELCTWHFFTEEFTRATRLRATEHYALKHCQTEEQLTDMAKKLVLGCMKSPPRPGTGSSNQNKLFWSSLYSHIKQYSRFCLPLNEMSNLCTKLCSSMYARSKDTTSAHAQHEILISCLPIHACVACLFRFKWSQYN